MDGFIQCGVVSKLEEHHEKIYGVIMRVAGQVPYTKVTTISRAFLGDGVKAGNNIPSSRSPKLSPPAAVPPRRTTPSSWVKAWKLGTTSFFPDLASCLLLPLYLQTEPFHVHSWVKTWKLSTTSFLLDLPSCLLVSSCNCTTKKNNTQFLGERVEAGYTVLLSRSPKLSPVVTVPPPNRTISRAFLGKSVEAGYNSRTPRSLLLDLPTCLLLQLYQQSFDSIPTNCG